MRLESFPSRLRSWIALFRAPKHAEFLKDGVVLLGIISTLFYFVYVCMRIFSLPLTLVIWVDTTFLTSLVWMNISNARRAIADLALEAVSLMGGRHGRWAFMHLLNHRPDRLLPLLRDASSLPPGLAALRPKEWLRLLTHPHKEIREAAIRLSSFVR